MKLFKKNDSDSFEESVANMVLEQPDRLNSLLQILNYLPDKLVDWFKGLIWDLERSDSSVDVKFIDNTNFELSLLPGDIILEINRDPKVGDIIKIGVRYDSGYHTEYVKINKIKIKTQELQVQNISDKESVGIVDFNSIILIVDKVLKYGSKEWNSVVKVLNINYDISDLKDNITHNIGILSSDQYNDFEDRDKFLKMLKDRLKLVK